MLARNQSNAVQKKNQYKDLNNTEALEMIDEIRNRSEAPTKRLQNDSLNATLGKQRQVR